VKTQLVYFGFVKSRYGLKMDKEKVKDIINWPTQRSISEVKNFHGLESFYRKLIKTLSGMYAPIAETIKGSKQPFKWT
jgi:hypothetical protein